MRGLTTACRHHAKHITARLNGFDQFPLMRAELREPEGLAEDVLKCLVRHVYADDGDTLILRWLNGSQNAKTVPSEIMTQVIGFSLPKCETK